MQDLSGQRVTVMGLGRFGGGVGVTRFLVGQGADVCVTDTEPAEGLAESIAQLADLPEGAVTYRLGEHNVSDFTTADLVVANPAVKPDNRFLRAAEAARVPITTEIRLLVERLPNRQRTIGVTGSAGKSTVTAMIGHVLNHPRLAHFSERAPTRVFVGGNLGGSLLPHLDQINPDDWVVLELSSFMLHHLRAHAGLPGWSPHIAVYTNLAPNHLDWHGSFDQYAKAKHVILDYQNLAADDAAVGGPGVHGIASPRVTRWSDFGAADDTWWKPDPLPPLMVPGEHNQLNARLAGAALHWAIGLEERRAVELLADFPGLPHRLQFVAEHNGVRFYNDSKSTTPEAARLAIDAFEPHTAHIILGGYDKGSDLKPLAAYAVTRCASLYAIGATGDTLATAAEAASAAVQVAPQRPNTCGGVAWPAPRADVIRCGGLDTAVREAVTRAKPGQVVLLSPGCASWDQFDHFEQRGHRFGELVLRYTTETGL